MTKKTWILFCVLVVIILALSSASSFFFFKTKTLEKNSTGSSPSPAIQDAVSTQPLSPSPSSTTSIQSNASSSTRPSNPTDTYVVKEGETLYGIANQNGLTLADLTAANGITDPNKVQAGQSLIIPKNGQIAYTVNTTQVTAIEKNISKYQFRLDPVQTAQADSSPVYGLQNTDQYTLQAKDNTAGTATVTVSKNSQKYLITLIQPDIKGGQGIWAITLIAVAK